MSLPKDSKFVGSTWVPWGKGEVSRSVGSRSIFKRHVADMRSISLARIVRLARRETWARHATFPFVPGF
ncbi:uncharacterized protein CIMG_13198 [Coccidioides immitis RS]|uniref:Uncharacterized protein n=1 Tax=Coccidioides immitis (strain RS) TaxID=246410 RepID=A0A0D8JTU7_COCIM|nr:uncharacterized protein CIMG_13198 [Coccidioides immitis RS]KJF60765.1 hypothetical protein CIMG_13198 [Coccidioides immitis RS]